MAELSGTEEQSRKIREQQKGHSDLLAAVKASIKKLEAKGRELAKLLPAEKQIEPLTFFMSISPAGVLVAQGSEEFTKIEVLKQLAEALCKCAKDVQGTKSQARRALHDSGAALPSFTGGPRMKQRKESRITKLQKSVQGFYRTKLQPKGNAALEEILANDTALGENMSAVEKRARKESIKQDGFTLHSRNSNCDDGCHLCMHYRRAIDWPSGVPLESNLAQLGTAKLETLAAHYYIPIEGNGESTSQASCDSAEEQAMPAQSAQNRPSIIANPNGSRNGQSSQRLPLAALRQNGLSRAGSSAGTLTERRVRSNNQAGAPPPMRPGSRLRDMLATRSIANRGLNAPAANLGAPSVAPSVGIDTRAQLLTGHAAGAPSSTQLQTANLLQLPSRTALPGLQTLVPQAVQRRVESQDNQGMNTSGGRQETQSSLNDAQFLGDMLHHSNGGTQSVPDPPGLRTLGSEVHEAPLPAEARHAVDFNDNPQDQEQGQNLQHQEEFVPSKRRRRQQNYAAMHLGESF